MIGPRTGSQDSRRLGSKSAIAKRRASCNTVAQRNRRSSIHAETMEPIPLEEDRRTNRARGLTVRHGSLHLPQVIRVIPKSFGSHYLTVCSGAKVSFSLFRKKRLPFSLEIRRCCRGAQNCKRPPLFVSALGKIYLKGHTNYISTAGDAIEHMD